MSVGKLYMIGLSPPCRAVMITARALGIQLELVSTDLMQGEHLTPEFLKMNPAHSVPTYLDNDGTAMGDSHTIMAYLVGKYGKDDSLYPRAFAKRAAVDQMLHFDSGKVYALLSFIVVPMWMRQYEGIPQKQLTDAESTYAILNAFLEGNTWVAKSERPTIADFSLATNIMALNVVAPMDATKCENVVKWLQRCEAIPYLKEVNQKDHDAYKNVLISMMNNDYSFMDKDF